MEDLDTLELINQEVEEKDGILNITANFRKISHLKQITIWLNLR